MKPIFQERKDIFKGSVLATILPVHMDMSAMMETATNCPHVMLLSVIKDMNASVGSVCLFLLHLLRLQNVWMTMIVRLNKNAKMVFVKF